MALTGLVVYGFLVGHLVGNFLLFRSDGGEQFNAYSAFLTEHPLLVPIELGLLAAFLLHIYFGITVARENRRARPDAYKKVKGAGRRSWASRSMVFSGIVILIFVVTHLKTFKYADHTTGTLYQLVMDTFSQPLYAAFYVFAMLVLGVSPLARVSECLPDSRVSHEPDFLDGKHVIGGDPGGRIRHHPTVGLLPIRWQHGSEWTYSRRPLGKQVGEAPVRTQTRQSSQQAPA